MVDLSRVSPFMRADLRQWVQVYETSGNTVDAWRFELDGLGLLRLHGIEMRGRYADLVTISLPVVAVDVRAARVMTTLGWRTLGMSESHGYPPDAVEEMKRAEAWCFELRMLLALPDISGGDT